MRKIKVEKKMKKDGETKFLMKIWRKKKERLRELVVSDMSTNKNKMIREVDNMSINKKIKIGQILLKKCRKKKLKREKFYEMFEKEKLKEDGNIRDGWWHEHQ